MITCDVIKCSYRQSKDGFVVAFVIHPQDMPVELASAAIGSQWQMRLVPLDENGNATTEKEAPTEDTGTTAGERGPHQESAAPVSRLTRQAAIACKDPVFRRFLNENDMPVLDADTTASAVRMICHVASRKEFVTDTSAGDRWEALYGKFLAWRDAP